MQPFHLHSQKIRSHPFSTPEFHEAIVNLWKNLDNLFFREAKHRGRLVRSPAYPPRRGLSKHPPQGASGASPAHACL